MAFGPVFVSGGVVLRPPRADDALARRELGVPADIVRMFGAVDAADGPMSMADAQRWYSSLGCGDAIEWVVEVDGGFLGTARLHLFSEDRSRARYAVGLFDPGRLGQGTGTAVTRLVIAHGFGALQLDEIELVVLDFNERARRCYVSCGFLEVERFPSDVVQDGREADDILMLITKNATTTS